MLAGSTVYGGYGGVRPNYYPWNTFLFWYAICFFIMFFPFLVCDLYYAYHDVTCAPTKPLPASSINMSLKQWLQVDGYIILGFIIIFLILGLIAWCSPELVCTYGWWEGLHVFFIIWRLTWLIVGAVIFWKGLNSVGACGRAIGRYMWANLIIGFIWLFVELILAFAYPRPVPYPVSVPVGAPVISTPAPIVSAPAPYFRPSSAIVV
jgi:hypothetical protein